ncbi:hypothetical protein ACLD5V_04840 [Gardnerella greenwoodii]|uniref:hypothetical protein n=1 Tax=Gardnerella greenwoodii TaxID=2914925 RepID=UPI003971113B
MSAAQRARKQLGAETNAREKSRQMLSAEDKTTTNAGKIHGKCGQLRQKRQQTPEKKHGKCFQNPQKRQQTPEK